jgi:hypothetical protein
MAATARKCEWALCLGFLAIIGAVPVAQTCLELRRGQRVQAADVFRQRPTSRNLRQYEETLREKSWFQQTLRPRVQGALWRLFHDTGARAVVGRDGWLFYRPDVRYLVEPDRSEPVRADSIWIAPASGLTERESVARAIVRFRDQLKERGIELLVAPAPGKPSVCPDQLTSRAQGQAAVFPSPTLELIAALRRQDVAVVDLFAALQSARTSARAGAEPSALYLARDTHWTPRGAAIAAHAVALALSEKGWSPPATTEFEARAIALQRWGDILEMMQIPGLREASLAETVECRQVRDPVFGLLVPAPSERPGAYKHPASKSQVLLLGDSFSRIYQFPEPRSLGELTGGEAAEPERGATKRSLPGSAGFLAQLALELKAPVDAIVSDGGASTDVRRRLSTHPEMLEGKKVVIWEFVERDIRLGREGWQDVPLPPRLQ